MNVGIVYEVKFRFKQGEPMSRHLIFSFILLQFLLMPLSRSTAESIIRVADENSPTQIVDTVAELLKLGKWDESVVYRTRGLNTDSDGLGGRFTFKKLPLTTPVIVGRDFSVTGGRLTRTPLPQDKIRAEWFGARLDPGFDNSWAIQRALDLFKRVDLMQGTYGVGKGLVVQNGKLVQLYANLYASLNLQDNYRISGAGKTLTTLRLINQINPRPSNGYYSMITSSRYEGANDVVIRDLSIDLNFDQQSKAERAPDDHFVDDNGVHYSAPAAKYDVATLAAISLFGSNPLIENIKVVGYSSNTYSEAFVVSTRTPFKSVRTPEPKCATIRNIEMTQPGSNLELRYRRFGREKLRSNPGYQHMAEITHIGVSGYNNFNDGVFSSTPLTFPNEKVWPEGPAQAISVNNMDELRQHPTDPKKGAMFIVKNPERSYFSWEPSSMKDENGLTILNPKRDPFKKSPGRLHKLPLGGEEYLKALKIDSSGDSNAVKALEELSGLDQVGWNQLKYVRSVPAGVAYFFYEAVPESPADEIQTYKSLRVSGVYRQRVPASEKCNSWRCDAGWDPTFLGENINNVTLCKGGVVENNWIHDVDSNAEAYSASGERYGITNPDGVNASYVHGITYSDVDGLIIRNNRFNRFQGIAVFVMSWWNRNVIVEGNQFEGVQSGLSLFSSIEGDGKPMQFVRHENLTYRNNTIHLNPYPQAPKWSIPIGIRLYGVIHAQNKPGSLFPGAFPDDVSPRMNGIKIYLNKITANAYQHYNPEYGTQYPRTIYIQNSHYTKNIEITKNIVDLDDAPFRQMGPGGVLIPFKPDNTGIIYYPYGGYLDAGEWHSSWIWDNYYIPRTEGSGAPIKKALPLLLTDYNLVQSVGAEKPREESPLPPTPAPEPSPSSSETAPSPSPRPRPPRPSPNPSPSSSVSTNGFSHSF